MELGLLKNKMLTHWSLISKDPGNEVNLILMDLLNVDKSFIYAYPEYIVDSKIIDKIDKIQSRRKKNEPLQYILNKAFFWGRPFYVDSRVLIPRKETELAVEIILNNILSKSDNFLEIGVGSGAISITVALESGLEQIIGADISKQALEVTSKNNNLYKANIKLIQSNLFEKIRGEYNIIFSNPPYIETKTINTLSKEVKDFEPKLALDGGRDGLDYYREIIEEAPKYLKNNGKLILEIGYNQGVSVESLLRKNGFYDIKRIKDFQSFDRILIGVKGGV